MPPLFSMPPALSQPDWQEPTQAAFALTVLSTRVPTELPGASKMPPPCPSHGLPLQASFPLTVVLVNVKILSLKIPPPTPPPFPMTLKSSLHGPVQAALSVIELFAIVRTLSLKMPPPTAFPHCPPVSRCHPGARRCHRLDRPPLSSRNRRRRSRSPCSR